MQYSKSQRMRLWNLTTIISKSLWRLDSKIHPSARIRLSAENWWKDGSLILESIYRGRMILFNSVTLEATWLLIFNNADDPMILADYWPQDSKSILVTSCDLYAKSMFTRRHSGLDLGPLTQQDSLSLFNNLTSIFNEREDDTAQRIFNSLCGVL